MSDYYSVLTTSGHVTVGESETLFLPSNPRPNTKFGVILLHGSGATYSMFSDAPHWASSELGSDLAMAGIPCLSIQMGGNTYANDVAMTAIDNAVTYLASAAGIPATKVAVLGISMGAGAAFRFAATRPTKVSAVVGLIPMANIIRIYTDNTLGLRSAIGTAWGVTYPTPLPAGADLLAQAPTVDANDIPVKFWYDDADPVILPADVTALAAAAGGTAVEIDPADLGHTEGSIKAVVDSGAGHSSEIINFLIANGS